MARHNRTPEDLPTEPVIDQLVTAFDDISPTEYRPSEFSIMHDGIFFDAVRPVFYEPFYYDKEELAPVSQRIIYSMTVRKKPAAQQQLIDMIDQVWNTIDELNRVKFYAENAQQTIAVPGFFERVHDEYVIDQAHNTSKTIGGLLMVKCAETNRVGLRCVYNKALMNITDEIDQLRGVEEADEQRTRDLSAMAACYGLANSIKRKPAIVTFPNTVGIVGL